MTDVIAAVCSVAVPLLMLTGCRYGFEGGVAVKRDDAWLEAWRVLLVAGVASSVAAYAFERGAAGADPFTALRWATAVVLSVLAAWSDMKERIVSNRQVAGAFAWGLAIVAVQIACDMDDAAYVLANAVLGLVAGATVFLLSRLVTKGGVGLGDVKLFAALGFLTGAKGVLNVMCNTMLLAFLVAVFFLATKRKKASDRLPLAPFALAGIVLSMAFGA